MLKLQIFTVTIMTKKKKKNIKKKINKNKKKIQKKKKKKSCDSRDLKPGYMGSKSTKISTTPWRPMHITDGINEYMLKL